MQNFNGPFKCEVQQLVDIETPSLSFEESSKLLAELKDDWIINESGQLYKVYNFSNFMEAMDFANKVAELAEEEAHHPDLVISWGKCIIRICTHKINGLTKNDFILAAKIGVM